MCQIGRVCCVTFVCIVLLGSEATAQPERERLSGTGQSSDIPEGFELQALELGAASLVARRRTPRENRHIFTAR